MKKTYEDLTEHQKRIWDFTYSFVFAQNSDQIQKAFENGHQATLFALNYIRGSATAAANLAATSLKEVG
jgi:hypothetical protein